MGSGVFGVERVSLEKARRVGDGKSTQGGVMKRERSCKALWLAVLLLATLSTSTGDVWGLTDEEIFRDFRFNFINPGARSVGLGGAFIAAADDATAAEANPAALHYVSRFEFFLEYRSVSPDLVLLEPVPGQFGSNDVSSTVPFLDYQLIVNREDTNFPSFASFVYPFRIGGRKRARLAFSRQVVLNEETSLSSGSLGTMLDVSLVDFPIVVNPGPPPTVERYTVENTVDGFLDAEVVHYNLGFSISLSSNFSFGLTATMAELSMDSQVDSEALDPRAILTSIHPRVPTVPTIRTRTAINDTDDDFTWTAGLHWHPDTVFPSGISPLRLGLVYHKGAEFGVTETREQFNPTSGQFEAGASDPLASFTNVLKVPDRWGVGSSYEAGRNWLFSLDVERIQYSDLLDGFQPGVNFFTSGLIPTTLLPVDPDTLVFDVDDGTVVHAGVEFNITSRPGWNHAVRVGYFNQPDNRIRLAEVDTGDPDVDELLLDLFRAGEDLDHYTVGFSFGTPVGLQLQFAGDFSDAGNEFVASGIYRFGKVR